MGILSCEGCGSSLPRIPRIPMRECCLRATTKRMVIPISRSNTIAWLPRSFPKSPMIAIALAKTLRDMGEPAEAVRALQEFAARQPRPNSDVLSLEGILEDEQGHHPAAENAHRAAVAAAPEQSDLHNNLGYNLLAQGRMDAAIEEFRRAVELDPKSDIAHNNLAAALARSGSATKDTTSEAIAEWSRSTGQAEAHNNMAAVLIDQGRYDEARAELAAALSMEPGLGAAHVQSAITSGKRWPPCHYSGARFACG